MLLDIDALLSIVWLFPCVGVYILPGMFLDSWELDLLLVLAKELSSLWASILRHIVWVRLPLVGLEF